MAALWFTITVFHPLAEISEAQKCLTIDICWIKANLHLSYTRTNTKKFR